MHSTTSIVNQSKIIKWQQSPYLVVSKICLLPEDIPRSFFCSVHLILSCQANTILAFIFSQQINTTRGIRPRGPSGFAIWAGIIGASVYGMYQVNLYSF